MVWRAAPETQAELHGNEHPSSYFITFKMHVGLSVLFPFDVGGQY